MKTTRSLLLVVASLWMLAGCGKQNKAQAVVEDKPVAVTDTIFLAPDTIPAPDSTLTDSVHARKPQTDREKANLKGRVKSVRFITYQAVDRYGEISKGEELAYEDIAMSDPIENSLVVYDIEGRETERTNFYPNNGRLGMSYAEVRTYDAEGRLIETLFGSRDEETEEGKLGGRTKYKYDKHGLNTMKFHYGRDGELQIKYVQKFDKKGNMIQTSQYSGWNEGELFNTSLHKYDDDNNCIEIGIGGGDGEIWSVHKYQYDAAGREIRHEWIDPDGGLQELNEYKYDADGNPTETHSVWVQAEKEYVYTYKYKFDNTGNWTERMIYRYGVPRVIQTRTIEYYK